MCQSAMDTGRNGENLKDDGRGDEIPSKEVEVLFGAKALRCSNLTSHTSTSYLCVGGSQGLGEENVLHNLGKSHASRR